ncbi:MAG: PEP-CTERM sorting domain-containing protein [Thiobacillus sp.]|nr:PEP-CTERM sorting domain-containing protein [Thiobacillus sp.]
MTNRTHRIRRIGLLGVALTTLLSPAGILISSAIATTALVGGLALHAQRSTPADPEVHPRPPALFPPDGRRLVTAAPETILIEHQGENMPIVLVDGSNPQHTLQRLDPILLASGNPPTPPANPGPGQPRIGHLPWASLPGNGPGGSPEERRPGPAPEDNTPPAPDQTKPLKEDEKPFIPPTAEERPGKIPDKSKTQPETQKPDDNTPPPPKITTPSDDQVPPSLPHETGETQRNPAAIPEPSGLGLMGLGLVAMVWMGRRQRVLHRRA